MLSNQRADPTLHSNFAALAIPELIAKVIGDDGRLVATVRLCRRHHYYGGVAAVDEDFGTNSEAAKPSCHFRLRIITVTCRKSIASSPKSEQSHGMIFENPLSEGRLGDASGSASIV